MARETLTALTARINDAIQENTAGEITATVMNELLNALTNNLYVSTPVPVIFGEMNITTNESNTVTIVPGQDLPNDTLIPITPGTTYFPVPGYSAGISEGLTYEPSTGGLRATVTGTYEFGGWLSCRHSVNASTVGVVFGIYRKGAFVGISPRPTPAELPNGGDLGLISGRGLVELQQGDTIVPLIGSDNSGTITINNSTLVGKLLKTA